MERSQYARTWELSKQLKRGRRAPDGLRPRASTTTCTGPSSATSSARRSRPPDRRRWTTSSTRRHEGYCQHYAGAMALLLRMGGIPARVATGFTPGGYSARKKAWIVRDTDAHAWVEVWFDKYGWVTIDPTPDATPARSQVAALAPAPGAAPPAAAADTGAADAARQHRAAEPLAAPGAAARPRRRPIPGAGRRGRRPRRSGSGRLVRARPGASSCSPCCCSSAARAARRRWTARSTRSRTRCERVGRPVTTGTTLTQLERRLGSHSPGGRRRTCARWPRAATRRRRRPRRAMGRRALRRALAQGLGFGGGLRALWALPPRLERGERTPRSRTFEVETSVRVRG